MTNFPGAGEIKIHFAHSAYRLGERFALRRPGRCAFSDLVT